MDPRSHLVVPGHRPDRFAKALASNADALSLDLKDAVDIELKAEVRDQGLQFLACSRRSLPTAWRDCAAPVRAVRCWPVIQGARGVLAAERVALCDGVTRLALGAIDVALDRDLSGDPIGRVTAGSLLGAFARARALRFGAKLCASNRSSGGRCTGRCSPPRRASMAVGSTAR